jgi:uncharacterized glyoxalase superfamily protein PhnB
VQDKRDALGRSQRLEHHEQREPDRVGQQRFLLGIDPTQRLTKIFNGLAEGGKIKGPLAKQPSGAEVGWLMDKFGVSIDKA